MAQAFPKPKDAKSPAGSLRYALILNGAVRKYPDGREVCQRTRKGRQEYHERTIIMAERQHKLCGICWRPMLFLDITFEHEDGRGMNGGHRDDRIVDDNGVLVNCAAHSWCNSEKGSRRADGN